nr:MAG TPA: hypothetical protein [Caudoviricetes sp.]
MVIGGSRARARGRWCGVQCGMRMQSGAARP